MTWNNKKTVVSSKWIMKYNWIVTLVSHEHAEHGVANSMGRSSVYVFSSDGSDCLALPSKGWTKRWLVVRIQKVNQFFCVFPLRILMHAQTRTYYATRIQAHARNLNRQRQTMCKLCASWMKNSSSDTEWNVIMSCKYECCVNGGWRSRCSVFHCLNHNERIFCAWHRSGICFISI